jgi:hypothetical protein
MIALGLAEYRRPCVALDLIPIDHRVCLVIGAPLLPEDRLVIERLLGSREIVDLVTGLLTQPAANTQCRIVENTAAVGIAAEILFRSASLGHGDGHPRGGHALEKASA